jgi:hypothetical protein
MYGLVSAYFEYLREYRSTDDSEMVGAIDRCRRSRAVGGQRLAELERTKVRRSAGEGVIDVWENRPASIAPHPRLSVMTASGIGTARARAR